MSTQDERVQVLMQLGLTLSQARIYLTLAQSGISTVKTISMVSNIAREHVYNIMPQLQDLGLVKKIIDLPTKFEHIPIQEGISMLLQRRREKTSELQGKTRELFKKFSENKAKTKRKQEDSQFTLISGRETLKHETIRVIENVRTSIDYVSSKGIFFPWMIAQDKLYKNALERGVKIRVILDKFEGENSQLEAIQSLKKESSFSIKYVPTFSSVHLGLYDRKKLYINTSSSFDFRKSTILRTNNSSLLTAIQDYFEILWITANREPVYFTDKKINEQNY